MTTIEYIGIGIKFGKRKNRSILNIRKRIGYILFDTGFNACLNLIYIF